MGGQSPFVVGGYDQYDSLRSVKINTNGELVVSIGSGGSGGGGGGPGGSTGHDFSANLPAFSNPPTDTVLLTTIPANVDRVKVEVQNQDINYIQIWRDDGAGAQLSRIVVEPAGETGRAGGGWVSTTFKGRIRIYGQAGSQVAAFED